MAKKRQPKHLPTYTYERASFKGISERLALASRVHSTSWLLPYDPRHLSRAAPDAHWFMHSVRYISKTEGWEARFTWSDDFERINLDSPGVKREIAMSIEGARAAWADAQHPSKELLEIVANAAARKAAA